MLGRRSVNVTYAHKRRRAQVAGKKLLSSPLEVLPPDMDDLTRTQMARRMLKRSRRVALAELSEEKDAEHIRERLAKRIKRNQEHVSDLERAEVPFNVSPQDDITVQTPFPSSQYVHGSAVANPPVPEQLSPVPIAKHVISRTSSRGLKENNMSSQTLASPFSSRPGSVASSPKHKGKGQPSRQVSRISLRAKSRALSPRRLSQKYSTISLKDADRELSARHVKHQRDPSSPSASYMRSRSEREDWTAPSKAFPRIFNDRKELPSSGGSIRSNSSFYADQPQSCSTPAIPRLRKLPGQQGRRTRSDDRIASFSPRKDFTGTGALDVEMTDDTIPQRRQTIHLSGNSIFSTSDEFTIGLLPSMRNSGTTDKGSNVDRRDKAPTCTVRQVSAHREAAHKSQAGHSLAGSFIAEYDIPLLDLDYSPVLAVATKMRAPRGASKTSVGQQPLGLPGTSPAHDGNLIIRTSRNPGTLTSPASPPGATATRPPSPASDVALGLQSMDISGNPDMHSDGEACSSTSIPLQTRSHSLRDVPAASTTKRSVKRRSIRNRAGTIRASDFAEPGTLLSSTVSRSAVSPLPNVRRTRSGTVVGLNSRLATKRADVGLPSQKTKDAPATRLATVRSGSESESDDELLLKGFWTEDLEYLGLAPPRGSKDAEPDELNLGGLWHGMEFGPAHRPGLRKR